MTEEPADNMFTCECCGGSFKKTNSEDQTDEMVESGFEGLELVDVCEDCYIMLMAARRRAAH